MEFKTSRKLNKRIKLKVKIPFKSQLEWVEDNEYILHIIYDRLLRDDEAETKLFNIFNCPIHTTDSRFKDKHQGYQWMCSQLYSHRYCYEDVLRSFDLLD